VRVRCSTVVCLMSTHPTSVKGRCQQRKLVDARVERNKTVRTFTSPLEQEPSKARRCQHRTPQWVQIQLREATAREGRLQLWKDERRERSVKLGLNGEKEIERTKLGSFDTSLSRESSVRGDVSIVVSLPMSETRCEG